MRSIQTPSLQFGRFTYETGMRERRPATAPASAQIVPNTAPTERVAAVATGPALLLSLDAVLGTLSLPTDHEGWVLAFDAPATAENVAAAVVPFGDSLGTARYSWGPVVPSGAAGFETGHGWLFREPQEEFPYKHDGCSYSVKGFPFDYGIILVASASPLWIWDPTDPEVTAHFVARVMPWARR